MEIVKLESNKRKLVTFLEGGEKPLYEIVEHMKAPDKNSDGITKQGTYKLIDSLNPNGLVSFRYNNDGEKVIRLNKENMVTKYSSDKFLPHVIVTGLALMASLFIGLFISKWFFLGTSFVIVPFFVYLSYQIFRTAKMKEYFYKKTKKPKKPRVNLVASKN